MKLAGNPDGGPTVKTLTSGRPANAGQLFVRHDGHGTGRHGLGGQGLHVHGNDPSTIITFTNTTADSPFGPALDSVIVTETLGTGAKCKNSGWKTMVDKHRHSFKNQGDCVSFYARAGDTERHNLGASEPEQPHYGSPPRPRFQPGAVS